MVRIHKVVQSRFTSRMLAPIWLMRTNPSMAEVLGMTRLAARMKSGRASTGQDTPTWKKSGRLTAMKRRIAVSRRRNQALDELGQEADGEHEGNRHQDEILEPSERREAVNSRQHDQIERKSRQREAEMRERLAEDGARARIEASGSARPPSA